MRRRAFLGALASVVATAGTGAALARRRDRPRVLSVGVMANLTHAPMLAGLGSGRLAAALAPTAIETRVFRSGPRVVEALVGGAIDVGTAGPAAVVIHHARHARSDGMRVLAGCASGGASLVVARGAVRGAADLRGKRVAVTQIGTTQDVALRRYLAGAGLRDAASGGDVSVLAIDAATILAEMRRGDLHAAWLPEPWATRLVVDAGAERLVDERDLWEDRRFASAVLVTRRRSAGDELVVRLAAALRGEVDRAVRAPEATRDEAYAELARHVGNPGARAVFDRAWERVDFTADPLRRSIERFADGAAGLGLCPRRDLGDLFAW